MLGVKLHLKNYRPIHRPLVLLEGGTGPDGENYINVCSAKCSRCFQKRYLI